ncbi:MAG: SpoIID/LytB domain-containing protein [Oscillospiraceae bacterium]
MIKFRTRLISMILAMAILFSMPTFALDNSEGLSKNSNIDKTRATDIIEADKAKDSFVIQSDQNNIAVATAANAAKSNIIATAPNAEQFVPTKITGWIDLPNGEKAYADKHGEYLTGPQEISGGIYLFNEQGIMQKGWQYVRDGWVYYDLVTGKMKLCEFYKDIGLTYYSDAAGHRVTGAQEIGGGIYQFSYYGVMQTGWQNIRGGWAYFEPSNGRAKLCEKFTVDGKIYYSAANALTHRGVLEVNGKTYSFTGEKNAAIAGGAPLNGGPYGYFSYENYELMNLPLGFYSDKFDTYFVGDYSYLYVGEKKIGNNYYYFDPSNGARMLKGWRQDGSKWMYYPDGKLSIGFFMINSDFYYSGTDGRVQTGWMTIGNDKKYGIPNEKGKWAKGWTEIDGLWYEFDQNGGFTGNTRGNKGIDVSSFQGHINWKQVADSGVTFAILRAMVWSGNASSGGYVVDPYFYENVEGAKANGVKVGAYIYSTAFNEAEIRGEVDFFVNMMAPLKASGFAFDLPVYVDYEDKSIVDNIGSYDRRTELLKYEMDLISANGYHTGMYMNLNWARNIVNAASLQNQGYDLWLAQWGPNMTWTNGTPAMWQYSNNGSVPGISGRVDLDYVYKDYSYIKGSAGGGISKTYTVYDINSQRKVTDTMLNILSGIVNNEVGDGLGLTGMDKTALWKAQAVAAHSWLLYHYENQNTTPSVGLKTDGEYESVKNTVYTVQDKVAIYGGRPINAMYGASCNGFTNSAAAFYGTAVPYLTNVDSHWEKEWSLSGSLTNKTYTSRRSSIESIVGAGAVASTSPENWVSVTRDNYGYVTSVRMCGQNVTVANAYDNRYGVVSGDFNPSYAGGETWKITNNGNGHCIGMSQWGAAAMVANGYSWDAIVRHYYPNTTISSY